MTSPTSVMTPPGWYVEALRAPSETFSVTVDGTSIAVRAWGHRDDPVLVLVHGAAAHARWWDHVAPLVADGFRVLAPDLSGHGESGRRASYSLDVWAREVLAVAATASSSPALLVGHSLGGWVVATAAVLAPRAVAGTITIDSSIAQPTPERDASRQRRALAPLRMYPTEADAVARFRPLPEHPGVKPYIADHIARHSVRRYDDGWSWKFDPRVFGRHRPTSELFHRVPGRFAMLRAEHGLAIDPQSIAIYDQLRRRILVVDLPDAGHHAMLDHPLALVTAVRTVLGSWRLDTSTPSSAAHAVAATQKEHA